MPFIDRKMAAQIREDLKKEFEQERQLTGRDLIKELVPDIRRAMKNRYTLDAIAETISKRTDMAPSTIRGYLYGKDSVMRDPEVVEALRKAGLDADLPRVGRKKTATARKASTRRKAS
jgi:hypothetical protein